MLLAAQERAREGVTDVRPGEGQWWTTAPRWGGGTSEGPEGEHHTEEDSNNHEKEKPHKRSKYDHPFLAMRRPRRMSNADRWKAVQPGPSLWEKRMRYMQIGKTVGSLYDDVRLSPLSREKHHLTVTDLHGILNQPPHLHPALTRPPSISRNRNDRRKRLHNRFGRRSTVV